MTFHRPAHCTEREVGSAWTDCVPCSGLMMANSEDGQAISKPVTGEELRALPGALAGNLFVFLSTYRGDAVNPTIPR